MTYVAVSAINDDNTTLATLVVVTVGRFDGVEAVQTSCSVPDNCFAVPVQEVVIWIEDVDSEDISEEVIG